MTPADRATLLALAAAIAACVILIARFVAHSIDRGTAFRTLDAELDNDACDDCREPLVEATRAITCGAHSLCVGCNADHNPCRECAYWAADAEANGSNL